MHGRTLRSTTFSALLAAFVATGGVAAPGHVFTCAALEAPALGPERGGFSELLADGHRHHSLVATVRAQQLQPQLASGTPRNDLAPQGALFGWFSARALAEDAAAAVRRLIWHRDSLRPVHARSDGPLIVTMPTRGPPAPRVVHG